MLARYPDSYEAIAIEVMATHSSKPREIWYLSVGIYSIAAKVPTALKYGTEGDTNIHQSCQCRRRRWPERCSTSYS